VKAVEAEEEGLAMLMLEQTSGAEQGGRLLLLLLGKACMHQMSKLVARLLARVRPDVGNGDGRMALHDVCARAAGKRCVCGRRRVGVAWVRPFALGVLRDVLHSACRGMLSVDAVLWLAGRHACCAVLCCGRHDDVPCRALLCCGCGCMTTASHRADAAAVLQGVEVCGGIWLWLRMLHGVLRGNLSCPTAP
jgi:hypothetical protein